MRYPVLFGFCLLAVAQPAWAKQCKNESTVTTVGEIEKVEYVKATKTFSLLIRDNSGQVCDIQYVFIKPPKPPGCVAGAKINATGTYTSEYMGFDLDAKTIACN